MVFIGLVCGAIFYGIVQPPNIVLNIELNASPLMMIVAGFFVGFGTRMGSRCTS